MWSKLASACCLVLSACASPHETEPQAVSLGGDVVRAMLEADVGRLVGLSRDCFSEQAVIPLHVVGSECERPAELFGKPVVDYDESRMRFDARREGRVRFEVLEAARDRVRVEIRKEGRHGMVAETWVLLSQGTWCLGEL